MDLTSHHSKSLSRPPSPEDLLGSDHPLTHVLEWHSTLLKHSVLITVLLAGAVVELVLGAPWAPHAAIGAGIAQAALALAALVLGQYQRELVLDLIIDGRGDLPLIAIERQRRRLLHSRTRNQLADRVEQVIRQARVTPAPPNARSWTVPISVGAVGPLTGELHAIAGLLRETPEDARAVALIERLLTDGGSGLYGGPAPTLRDDVHRIRFLLS
jgi:hypothetical protein